MIMMMMMVVMMMMMMMMMLNDNDYEDDDDDDDDGDADDEDEDDDDDDGWDDGDPHRHPHCLLPRSYMYKIAAVLRSTSVSSVGPHRMSQSMKWLGGLAPISLVVAGADTPQGKLLLERASQDPMQYAVVDVYRWLRAFDPREVSAVDSDCVSFQVSLSEQESRLIECISSIADDMAKRWNERKIWIIRCSTGKHDSEAVAKLLVSRIFNKWVDGKRFWNANIFSLSWCGCNSRSIDALVLSNAKEWADRPWTVRHDARKYGENARLASIAMNRAMDAIDVFAVGLHNRAKIGEFAWRPRPILMPEARAKVAAQPAPGIVPFIPAPPPAAWVARQEERAWAARRGESDPVTPLQRQSRAASSTPLGQGGSTGQEASASIPSPRTPDIAVDESLVSQYQQSIPDGNSPTSRSQKRMRFASDDRPHDNDSDVCGMCGGTGKTAPMPQSDSPALWEAFLHHAYRIDIDVCAMWIVLYEANAYYKVQALHIIHELISTIRRGEEIDDRDEFVTSRVVNAWGRPREFVERRVGPAP